MGHKCFISFKTEDVAYKLKVQQLNIDMIDRSLDNAIESDNEEYILRKIREDYLSDSTVTIHLIGMYSSENRGTWEQRYIKRELHASLYNGENNTRNGILGVVLPPMYSAIYSGSGQCSRCGKTHTYVNVMDSTTIKEFSYNYYLPTEKCAWDEDDRYCVLVKWDDFTSDPNKYIDLAFDKRNLSIAEKIKVYPK